MPHEVFNLSDTEPVVAVVARSDASEWENIVDYPSRRRPGESGSAPGGRTPTSHLRSDG